MGILSAFPGKSKPKLQSKTVTPTTSTQNVTPDSEYDGLDKVTVNRIPTSYVQPSSTQGTKTWTPGTSNQYIPAGTYCSGQQTIQGDADLVASNIKSGVNIFGVTGTYAGGKGTPSMLAGTVVVGASTHTHNKLIFDITKPSADAVFAGCCIYGTSTDDSRRIILNVIYLDNGILRNGKENRYVITNAYMGNYYANSYVDNNEDIEVTYFNLSDTYLQVSATILNGELYFDTTFDYEIVPFFLKVE